MITFLKLFSLVELIYMTAAYNLFEGLIQQGEPCFETVNGNDCNTQLSQVYSPPYKGSNINSIDTRLWLFTVKNPDKGEPLHKCGGKLPEETDFDSRLSTIVIVHGWLDGVCRTAWMREIKDQLFQRGKYNIILVDWTWGNTFDFSEASVNAIVAGEDIAFVVLNILKQTKMKCGNKFHFIGHSFGAFAVNEAARYILKRKPRYKIRRMTLLDPAIAPYRADNALNKLNADNAKFTDVIHGDAGDCFPINFGIYTAVGHADFFPNGGGFQGSCYPYAITSVLKGDLLYGIGSLLYPPLCSHVQAIQYFKVSINHPQGLFIAAECENYTQFILGGCKRCCKKDFSKCAVMGMDAEKHFPHLHEPKKNRTYYLNLGAVCPYNEDYKFSVNRDC